MTEEVKGGRSMVGTLEMVPVCKIKHTCGIFKVRVILLAHSSFCVAPQLQVRGMVLHPGYGQP